MSIVNMLQAKTNLSKLVEAVESGTEDEIIIARNGKPAARLVPIVPKLQQPRPLGLFEGLGPTFTWEEWQESDRELVEYFEKAAAEKAKLWDSYHKDDDAAAS